MAMILGNIRFHNIEALTPETVRAYSGVNLNLFKNIRIDGENIVGDLREDAFADLSARYALVRNVSGRYNVVDLHDRVLHCLPCEDEIIEMNNAKQLLEEKAIEANALPCSLRKRFYHKLVERPIVRFERGAFDIDGKDWDWGNASCPECGVELIPVFSKYYRHP